MSNIESLKPFKSGYDPRRNLKGRPKGSGNVRKALKNLLEKEVGKGENTTKIKNLLLEKIIDKAVVKGDMKAIKLIWEYLDGKPARQKSKPYLD